MAPTATPTATQMSVLSTTYLQQPPRTGKLRASDLPAQAVTTAAAGGDEVLRTLHIRVSPAELPVDLFVDEQVRQALGVLRNNSSNA